MPEDKKYKLVGVINYFDLDQDVLSLVYQGEDGEYYGAFTDEETSPYIDGFERFIPKAAESEIMFLDVLKNDPNIKLEIEDIKEEYKIGDLPVGAIMPRKGVLYVAGSEKFIEYLRNERDRLESIINGDDEEEVVELLSEFNNNMDSLKSYLESLKLEIADYEKRTAAVKQA